MHYIMPTWRHLKDLSETLAANYRGTNPTHLDYIKFYQIVIKLIENNPTEEEFARRIACGGLFFIIYRIESEERNAETSTLLNAIKSGMNLTENNPSTDIDQFVLYVEIYNYVNKIKKETMFDDDIWLCTIQFNEICEQRLIYLIFIVVNEIKYLFKLPDSLALANELRDLKNQYQNKKENQQYSLFSASASREQQVNLLTEINAQFKTIDENKPNKFEEVCQDDYLCRMGVVLHVALQINQTYQTASADRSVLYKLCKRILHVEHLSDIPNKIKIKWLQAFASVYQTQVVVKDKPLLQILQGQIQKLALESKSSVADKAVDFAKKSGSALVAETLVSQMPPTLLYAADAGVGLAGYSLFGPVGGIVASQICRMTRETILPTLLAYSICYLYEAIENYDSKTKLTLKDIHFNFPKETLSKWLGVAVHYGIFFPNILEWGEALVKLDTSIFMSSPETLVPQAATMRS